MVYETKFLVSLAITLLIEVPLAVIAFRYILKLREVSLRTIIFVGILASSLTLPYLWFIIPRYVDARLYLLWGETIIILAEAVIYNQLLNIKIIKALLASTSINLISYYLGIFMIYLLT